MYFLFILILLLIYLYGIRQFTYWKSRGIKHDKPLPFFGNNFRNFIQKATMGMLTTEIYNKYPEEKVVGFYRGTSPGLIIRDPEIVKKILTTDFHQFYARGVALHKTVSEPMLRSISFVDGDLWALLRQYFPPAFSPMKLKASFKKIAEKCEKLQLEAEKKIAVKDSFDMLEFMKRYTIELSGMLAFGIDVDCFQDDSSIYMKLSKRVFEKTPKDLFFFILKSLFPEVCKNVKLLPPDVLDMINEIIKTVLEQKNYKSTGTCDFLDLLLNLKQEKSKVTAESVESRARGGPIKIVELEIDDELIPAQVFNFYIGIYETTSVTASHALHQLAFHPDCQKRAQTEVDEVLKRYNDELTYEAVKEMKYLEMVMYEVMRLYPAVAVLERVCTSPQYEIPEIYLTITEDVKILIPVQALHWDEKYFKNPNKFDPERFHPSNTESKSFVYMPFGKGPRACVGERLGHNMAMAGIAAILQKFDVEPASNSVLRPLPSPSEYIIESFRDGLPLKLRKRLK